jgi:DNA ligase-1
MNTIIKSFPLLYKKTSTGAIQMWQVSVCLVDDIATIVSNYGQKDGKIQESKETILEGKNTGKSNATTAIEQALFQAESDWKGKLKKGYVETIEDAQAGKTDSIIEGGVFPMLAHKFSEQGHKIKYPALCQPKLDGHRCIEQTESDDITIFCSLWSRTRKPIKSSPHISQSIREVFRKNNIELSHLDGELYNHDYHNNFEELSSLIRQDEPKPGHENIQYHVYDIPHNNLTNYERYQKLETLRPLFEGTPIHIVETIVVNDEEELMLAFQHFLDLGYEGCMVRNSDGKYVNKRSYDLQKVKEFDDSEYLVVDVKVGNKGRMAGKAVFVCETQDGTQFSAKMIGNMDDLVKFAEHPELAVGRYITVKHQGLTGKNSVPRFPVAMRFREDL